MPFLYNQFLDSRAEILEIISLVFWKKSSFHKDIIKLTDLYLSSTFQPKGEQFENSDFTCWGLKNRNENNF